MVLLTNPRAERVKSVSALVRRSVRSRRGRFVAEGPQAVREAVLHRPESVIDLYVDHEARALNPAVALIAADAEAAGCPVTSVAPPVMAAMADTPTPQGVLAVCSVPGGDPAERLADLLSARPRPRLLVILAAVRDPGNVGTIIRSADAAGADGVLISTDSVDPYHPKCVRATAGSVFHLPILTGLPMDHLVDRLHEGGLRLLAADGSAPRSLQEVDLVTPHAWVLGNEAWGLPESVREQCDDIVSVPIYGHAESLNVATAATLCLYGSATAQRGPHPGRR